MNKAHAFNIFAFVVTMALGLGMLSACSEKKCLEYHPDKPKECVKYAD